MFAQLAKDNADRHNELVKSNADFVKSNKDFVDKMDAIEQRLTDFERPERSEVKREDSVEKPSQGVDAFAFPPAPASALAFKQFPQFIADNKWKPEKISYSMALKWPHSFIALRIFQL